ncbi:MAG: hypothetical protein IJ408_04200 [Clostridia bacterium]|nr:hypothetical protein [Clostridia bacterium]
MELIDIHTHILFGMDDGAKTKEDTLELLQEAYDGGTRAVFFTPHNDRGGFDLEKASAHTSELAPVIRERFPGLRIYGGCEVLYSHSVADSLLAGQIPTMNGTQYVLCEFMPGIFGSEALSAVRNIVNCGYIPIIAHAERYINLRKKNISELIDNGALIQLNAKAVLGKRGFAVKRVCKDLLRGALVHFIASDAHNMKNRSSDLSECAKYIEKKYGKERMQELFYDNPNHIINNN